jgi:3-hydroxyisobutyrate dehydrogenase
MGIALDLATELGVPAPLTTSAVALWRQAVAALPPGADHTAIVQWLEKERTEQAGTARPAESPA